MTKSAKAWLGAFLLALSLAGPGAGQTPQPWVIVVSKPPPPVVPSDPPQGLIYQLRPDLSASEVSFDTSGGPTSLEYLQFSADGSAAITFDDGPNEGNPGGVMIADNFLGRSGGHFDSEHDRLISGEKAGLLEPKDLALAPGAIIVADFGAARLSVFDLDAEGDAAPRFTKALGLTGGEPRRPWGLAFDAAKDRLFVGATDGAVLVFDKFLSQGGETSRIIIPSANGQKISANAHDLVYLKNQDLLIVSDVGAATTPDQPGFETDGAVYTIRNAGQAEGHTGVDVYLSGPNSLLGNPVGLAFSGGSLFVTERTKDVVLRFDDFLSLGHADAAPDAALTVPVPEAVVLTPGF